jgi:beta-phosphoglucomutase-like phosphatase (HAD superfamily)
MIKALLFDMDGTLLDSSQIHERAYAEALQQMGLDVTFDYSSFAGRSTKDVMNELGRELGLTPEIVSDLVRTKQSFSSKYFRDCESIPLYSGVLDGLEKLYPLYRLALCTSASKGTVNRFFESGVERRIFECVITSEEVSRAKPHPEIYLKALDLLALKPLDAMVVEDSEAGIISGLDSGAHVACITYGESTNRFKRVDVNSILWFENFYSFVRDRIAYHESNL